MKELTLKIIINRPASDVYAFYINPKNTPLWVDSFVEERTSEWPIKIGTHYINQSKNGSWGDYTVTALKENELFEFVSKDGNYHVRYSHKPIDEKSSELTYFEWVDKGDLEEPFTIQILEKLKTLVENN
jgi:hypothetical protein